MRDDLFECGGRGRVRSLQERCTSGFKPKSPKPCTWSRVKVPPRSLGRSPGGLGAGQGARGRAPPRQPEAPSSPLRGAAASSYSHRAARFPTLPSRPSTASLERTVAHICLVPGARPRAALPTPRAFRQSGPAQCSRARSRSGPARLARTRAGTPPPSEWGGGKRGRHGGRGRRRRRRPHRLRRGSSSPSRVPSAAPEPREGETLSPGMQREEGFNTKMADGPDEYDTEAGCVPLLHPEVRDRTERIPRPSGPDLSPPPPDLRRAVA